MPPICHSGRFAQHDLQQGGEIPPHDREDEIINLRFTHDATKLFNSGAKFYSIEAKNMPKRNLIVGSSMKKRLIHPNLMIWEDTRKTIGGDGILEIEIKPPNPS